MIISLIFFLVFDALILKYYNLSLLHFAVLLLFLGSFLKRRTNPVFLGIGGLTILTVSFIFLFLGLEPIAERLAVWAYMFFLWSGFCRVFSPNDIDQDKSSK